MRAFCAVILSFCAVLTLACPAEIPIKKPYPATAKLAGEVAVVRGGVSEVEFRQWFVPWLPWFGTWKGAVRVGIVKVDERSIAKTDVGQSRNYNRYNLGGWRGAVHILPGRHVFEVDFVVEAPPPTLAGRLLLAPAYLPSSGSQSVTFHAQPSHLYGIHAEISKMPTHRWPWRGEPAEWKPYVVDLATGAVVSSTQVESGTGDK